MGREGQKWAYRERAHTSGDPLLPVEVVKEGPKRSQKVKIRWLEGEYEGLEEWVPQVRLRVLWDEVGSLIEEERQWRELLDHSEDYSKPTTEALEELFFALPNATVWFDRYYLQSEQPEVDARLMGFTLDQLLSEPHSFIDRKGNYCATAQTALKLAKHCCQRFAETVLNRISGEEKELREEMTTGYSDKGYRLDTKRVGDYLAERQPVFSLIREWCGVEKVEEFDQVQKLRREVERLQEIIKQTADFLKSSGHPQKAAMILREMSGEGTGAKRRH